MMGNNPQEQEGRMEGWLHLIRSGRFGLHYSQKRYFVLEGSNLNCFNSAPTSKEQDPKRSALIDSTIRVTDDGRERLHRKVLYAFTLYNSSNHSDQFKLGARSSEEAARWIHSLMEATLKESSSQKENTVACSSLKWQPFRFSNKRVRRSTHSIDWTFYSSMNSDPTTSDVIAPSPWTIFGCKNGLRLFREAKDAEFRRKCWDDDHPAVMAVGVIDAASEAIFQTVMSLGSSRSEWDFCFYRGNVVEHLDGHTDIIYKQLKGDWLPWWMKCRDLLLRRYWRREDDGTYGDFFIKNKFMNHLCEKQEKNQSISFDLISVILYHSVFHQSCPPQRGFVRACLKSGGYVISPVKQGKESVVKHMLAIDWRFWKSHLFSSSAKHVTIRMLGRIAALREFFRANLGTCSLPESTSGEIARVNGTWHEEITAQPMGQSSRSEGSLVELRNPESNAVNENKPFLHSNDASDEFFDVPENSEYDDFETRWSSDGCLHSQDQRQTKLSSAAVFVKKLHDLAVQKRGYVDLQEAAAGDRLTTPCSYGATLPKDPTCSLLCSWSTADPSTFLIRGKTYLQDYRKITANGTLMQMVAADWLRSDKREDDLAGRPNSIVQKYAAQGGNEFFFIVNIQVPGSTTYSLALYYMMDSPIEKFPLLESFVKRDDAYRSSRFKLIPYISKGSWIVKQSVGKRSCLVGQALVINYFCGRNYLELGVDIGSSTIARGVVSLVLGYLNNLVIEMAFLIQANSEEELPEFLLGTCRLNHLDATKSVPVRPW